MLSFARQRGKRRGGRTWWWCSSPAERRKKIWQRAQWRPGQQEAAVAQSSPRKRDRRRKGSRGDGTALRTACKGFFTVGLLVLRVTASGSLMSDSGQFPAQCNQDGISEPTSTDQVETKTVHCWQDWSVRPIKGPPVTSNMGLQMVFWYAKRSVLPPSAIIKTTSFPPNLNLGCLNTLTSRLNH